MIAVHSVLINLLDWTYTTEYAKLSKWLLDRLVCKMSGEQFYMSEFIPPAPLPPTPLIKYKACIWNQ